MAILTPEEIVEAVNLDPTEALAQNDMLTRLMGSTEEAIDFLCGPTAAREVIDTVTAAGMIPLSTRPVLSLTSVVGDTVGALTVGGLTVNPKSGVIRKPGGMISADTYVVTYQAGRSTVPSAHKDAAAIILRHLWDARRGPNRQRNTDTTPVEGLGFAIPNRALQLLTPTMLGPGC